MTAKPETTHSTEPMTEAAAHYKRLTYPQILEILRLRKKHKMVPATDPPATRPARTHMV